jgi:hypothetical protein
MNSPVLRVARFLVGFSAVAITCAFVLERSAWKEQMILLLIFSVVAGLICAFCDRAIKAVFDHWAF